MKYLHSSLVLLKTAFSAAVLSLISFYSLKSSEQLLESAFSTPVIPCLQPALMFRSRLPKNICCYLKFLYSSKLFLISLISSLIYLGLLRVVAFRLSTFPSLNKFEYNFALALFKTSVFYPISFLWASLSSSKHVFLSVNLSLKAYSLPRIYIGLGPSYSSVYLICLYSSLLMLKKLTLGLIVLAPLYI